MSGLSRTPGKRVGVHSPPRVRIPLSPPIRTPTQVGFFMGGEKQANSLACEQNRGLRLCRRISLVGRDEVRPCLYCFITLPTSNAI
jgi:hypothetical protein